MSLQFRVTDGLFLKEFISEETLFDEHKEFCVDNTLELKQEEDITKYINTGIIDDKLNKSIINSISRYIKLYFPKYFTTFLNSPAENRTHGYFNIGVSDNGYITGIPIFASQIDLVKEVIINTISNILKKEMICSVENDNSISDILSNMTVEIHKLNQSNNFDDENSINQLISYYQHAIARYKINKIRLRAKLKEYNKKYKRWYELILKYSAKKTEVLNDKEMRYQFVDFVRDNYHLVNQKLVDEPYIFIKDYSYREVCLSLTDYDNLIMLFRDSKRRVLIDNRPEKPNMNMIDPRINAIKRLTPLMDKIIKNNSVQYILIRFKIPLQAKPKCIYAYATNSGYSIKKRMNKVVNGRVEPECQDS